ncbi:hypothetical protein K458DRAFT_408526 [Lentithecium fluviatile CBS 122367]|uniref:Uncharacterized protein n=1 Tax=Lentithecium fluviatile CBS 122367 TaxID=1168545 RepID=A0A6G1ILF7_9PLEO|nr:hypothetical protein K458DRAFT_408526 [Lentithecium fluviatile CBS 122367]
MPKVITVLERYRGTVQTSNNLLAEVEVFHSGGEEVVETVCAMVAAKHEGLNFVSAFRKQSWPLPSRKTTCSLANALAAFNPEKAVASTSPEYSMTARKASSRLKGRFNYFENEPNFNKAAVVVHSSHRGGDAGPEHGALGDVDEGRTFARIVLDPDQHEGQVKLSDETPLYSTRAFIFDMLDLVDTGPRDSLLVQVVPLDLQGSCHYVHRTDRLPDKVSAEIFVENFPADFSTCGEKIEGLNEGSAEAYVASKPIVNRIIRTQTQQLSP